ncbi:tetraacyldisaccharide 4'-kinase [Sphingobacterium humi]|uniref:Tetraacyldisaccharide 4'-kinase n=1 Tax=Sphingobacterium humi TaxID=1796905 RepID=A0A6N8L1J3_9SPHI|nr:tetraacyldisaccharide 4'-kinase [Sphingobacterium humi]MVZ63177.1 tetraacyldisaccharide 4'-kinase [Sphingobacterium humi]
MAIVRWLLLPFTILYSLIIWLRNKLYDLGIFSSQQFKVNSIVIGNLAIGGAGKSPLVQYLIQHFKGQYKLATLSRGYGRKTKGFRLVNLSDTATEVGDEPLQFKKNYPDITVAVDENRAEGIQMLQKEHQLILLDDAFQHRKITPTCAILLFDYPSLLSPILLLPTGNFRDTFDQTKRADIILITKCPDHIPAADRETIIKKLRKQQPSAGIYFSSIQYLGPIAIQGLQEAPQLRNFHILLLTGIANPKPLYAFLSSEKLNYQKLTFPDHHNFSQQDYQKIAAAYAAIPAANKLILCTEKDAQRLDLSQLSGIPIAYIPIASKIENEAAFLENIQRFLPY